MKSTLSLAQYVKKRNGVPLGASGSMTNMLSRALGASSFWGGWQYWNPIWGYYLSRNIMRPLASFLPVSLAILVTFLVSGALHDIAVSIIKWKIVLFFTPWFGLMGLVVIVSKAVGISYGQVSWPVRALTNASFIFVSLGITYFLETLYA
ncbi:acyltransferase [Alteromonas mediterranea]|uniref:Acyltransferase n=1 Tax=Alteromonas mediterranea TaxID=314275 RepID=A0AAC9J9R9_9ALTE|nr:acyltransferase [Alteromonas mediterranea]APD89864.1 acyltransferase [Alteromonas mediterranea]QDG34812.1 acyltransferase [Alteromonas mediterranea]